jgi:hypothetical protein
MKTTKKNGAKRNPVLVLAVLGLLIGAGATGAIAAGLVPSLDTGVSGSVTATVTTSALMTVGGTGLTTYASDSDKVKFSETLDPIAVPGATTFDMTLTVNRLATTAVNAVVINMKGINEYTRVSLTGSTATDGATGTVVRLGDGLWAITGLALGTDSAPAVFTLSFNIYVNQQSTGVDGNDLNFVWDFDMTQSTIAVV